MKKLYRLVLLLGLSSMLFGSGLLASDVALHVYKDPNCGCCTKWIDHLRDSGIEAEFTETHQLASVKAKYGIRGPYQSCHTAVSKEGFVFEGHVPARLVQQFLDNPPKDSIGLTVPGMPVGSPGMEMGDRFQSYQVLLLQKDGTVRVYSDIQSRADQGVGHPVDY